MARPIKILHAETEIVKELRRRSQAATASVRDRERAEVILLRLQGKGVEAIAEQLNTTPKRVSTWSKRFEMAGLAGLDDKKGRGRKPSIPDAKVASIITEATRPPKGRSRWSTRSMAKHAGVSASTVQRIWSRNDLKPHITKIFKLSNDPDFEAKFWDVVGLYLDPPDKALVLCCDEKSQCQALERTQLALPLAPKRPRTMTHDYTRHGTVTLFAALNVLEGKLISRTEAHHTHVEWLRFLKQIDRETPKDLDLHLIADNYATHKHPRVKAWLKRHPRFTMHYTPTSSSWLNLIERFFADLTEDVIRSGSFASVGELVRDINAYLADRNANPKRYEWKAEGADILEKIQRARAALEATKAQLVNGG
jgi:transcriptional regulator with XRE-family HTH domain